MKTVIAALAAILSLAALSLAASSATAATLIDLDGRVDASVSGTTARFVEFAPGTYTLRFVQGAHTAFSRFDFTSGCDAAGANCAFGYENSVVYTIDGQSFAMGDNAGRGGVGPQPTGGYFDTPARSLAHAASYAGGFTLTAPTRVGFYIFDDLLDDNRGGISVLATAVPEPAGWLTMIAGIGAIGWHRRRTRAAGARAGAGAGARARAGARFARSV